MDSNNIGKQPKEVMAFLETQTKMIEAQDLAILKLQASNDELAAKLEELDNIYDSLKAKISKIK